jgi:hypothetical protein
MRKMKAVVIVAVTFSVLLILSAFLVGWVKSNEPIVNSTVFRQQDDVYVLTHINDQLSPEVVRSMLSQLKGVTGIQLDVWVGDNTTSAIWDAKDRLIKWLDAFPDYKVLIQMDYAFDQKYGYYNCPFWVYNNTATLSQEWYNEWYGNLSEVLNQRSNVQLLVGFNEPYNHFRTKEMAQTVMEREYLTWKNLSSIPFSTKFLMPYGYWADYWGFPANASVENDCVPFWANYSDYIGIDLWAERGPPQYGGFVGTSGLDRTKEVTQMLEHYSSLLNKPILIDEVPTWDTTTFQYVVDKIMKSPNIIQIYQLWYWTGQEEKYYDSSTYGIFNVNPITHQISKGQPEWRVFNSVFNPGAPCT